MTGTRKHRVLPVEETYRELRLSNLGSPRYRHLLLLLWWVAYGCVFAALECFRTEGYTAVYSPLDDLIPFCEYFAIPYFFWFVYLVGMYAYSLFYDIAIFKKYTYYIMITYTAAIVIYLIFPTMQELRPTEFPRDNVFTHIMRAFYEFDTNTNVCPSIHVIGAIAVSCAAWNSKLFSTWRWRVIFSVVTVLIIVSTVFLKQHSVVDIPPAILICAIAYPMVFGKKRV